MLASRASSPCARQCLRVLVGHLNSTPELTACENQSGIEKRTLHHSRQVLEEEQRLSEDARQDQADAAKHESSVCSAGRADSTEAFCSLQAERNSKRKRENVTLTDSNNTGTWRSPSARPRALALRLRLVGIGTSVSVFPGGAWFFCGCQL